MIGLRKSAGFGALFLCGVALNLLVLRESLFDPWVFVPLILGQLSGALWLVLRVLSLSGTGEHGRGLYGVSTAVGIVAFLGICIVLYAMVKRWDASWDLTREGRRELSTQTVQVLKGLDKDVTVTCFFVKAGGDDRVDTAQDKTERFLERCARHSRHLKVEFSDPQRDPTRLEALNVLRVSAVGTVVIRCGTRQREIPLSDVTTRLEERDFTNALINVVRDAQPVVYFLTGHGERETLDTDKVKGGSYFKLWLEKEAYAVKRHLIAMTKPSIPEDCSVLVVNGFQGDFHPQELDALDAYIGRGGRLFILADPQIVLPSTLPQIEQLRPWLKTRFGIEMGTDVVVSLATDSYKLMFIPDFNDLDTLGDFAGSRAAGRGFRGSFNGQHSITRGLDKKMVLSVVRTVGLAKEMPKGVSGWVLLQSTPDTWAETDLQDVVGKQPINRDEDEAEGPNPVGVAVAVDSALSSGDRGARVVVLGDADLTGNEAINFASNQNFLLNTIAWLTESEDLIAIRATGKEDPPVLLSEGEERVVAWIASLGVVQAVALAGLVMFLARRRYR